MPTNEELEPIDITTLIGTQYQFSSADQETIGRFWQNAYASRVWGYSPSWLVADIPEINLEAEQSIRDTARRLEAFQSLEIVQWVLDWMIRHPYATTHDLADAYRSIRDGHGDDGIPRIAEVISVTERVTQLHQYFHDHRDLLVAAMPILVSDFDTETGTWFAFLQIWISLFWLTDDYEIFVSVTQAVYGCMVAREVGPKASTSLATEGCPQLTLTDMFYHACLDRQNRNVISWYLHQHPPSEMLQGKCCYKLVGSSSTIPILAKYWTRKVASSMVRTMLALHQQEQNHHVWDAHPYNYDVELLVSIAEHLPDVIDNRLGQLSQQEFQKSLSDLLYLVHDNNPEQFTPEQTKIVASVISQVYSSPRPALAALQDTKYWDTGYAALFREHNPALMALAESGTRSV